MFESIVEKFPEYAPTVLSREPWLVQFDNFTSSAEIDAVLSTTGWPHAFKRSTDQGKIDKYGEQEQVVSTGRTSTNAWCRDACENHPDVQSIIKKIERVTTVPYQNYESFQVLQYEAGEFYRMHHDQSAHVQTEKIAGPRVLTFFMYFSDVPEGGETRLNDLNIKVRPKKGR